MIDVLLQAKNSTTFYDAVTLYLRQFSTCHHLGCVCDLQPLAVWSSEILSPVQMKPVSIVFDTNGYVDAIGNSSYLCSKIVVIA